MLGLVPGLDADSITDLHLAKEIQQCDLKLTDSTSRYGSENNVNKRWAALLYSTMEGEP